MVEAFALESRQLEQGAARQQLEEETQQLGGSEGRLGREGFRVKGVFLQNM
jgi:hypothetical protein